MEIVAIARATLVVLDHLITKSQVENGEPDPELVAQRTELRRQLAEAAKDRTTDGAED